MRRLALALAVAIPGLLAGCGSVSIDLANPETLEGAIETVERFNAAGVDPVNLSNDQRGQILAACFALSVIGAFVEIEGEPVELSDLDAYCAVISKIAE